MNTGILPLLWHNGKIKTVDGFSFPSNIHLHEAENEFIEQVHCYATKVIELEEVYRQIKATALIYGMEHTLFRAENGAAFQEEIRRLHIRNNCYKWSCCHIWFRNSSKTGQTNLYLLLESETAIIGINQVSKMACFIPQLPIPEGMAINLPSIYLPYLKMAMHETVLQECQIGILLHSSGYIVDSTHGNLFAVYPNKITTTSPTCGTKPSVFRPKAIQLLKSIGFNIFEEGEISPEDLSNAQELFVVGNSGIFAIKGLESKRFYDKVRIELSEIFLKEILLPD